MMGGSSKHNEKFMILCGTDSEMLEPAKCRKSFVPIKHFQLHEWKVNAYLSLRLAFQFDLNLSNETLYKMLLMFVHLSATNLCVLSFISIAQNVNRNITN